MKSQQAFFFFIMLSLSFYHCTKNRDERDAVIGNYTGIGIHTYWDNVDTFLTYDTSKLTLTLIKAPAESILEVVFDSNFSNTGNLFLYSNGLFTSTMDDHTYHLIKSHDSLFFFEHAGLGPDSNEAIVRKD